MNFLEANHISHCNYSITGKVEGATITVPGADPLGGWSDNELSVAGRISKEIIGRWPRFEDESSAPAVSEPTVVRSGAYPSGVPHAIPGIIDPTHYDYGGSGVAYFDTTVGNFGNGPRQDLSLIHI